MKKVLFLLLFASSGIYAESRVLAPVSDNSSYPAGARSNRAKPPANALYEVFGRLEQMQHEIQQLRGQVEEQAQLISKLKRRQGNIYSDLDLRLQELAGGSELDNPDLIPKGRNIQGMAGSSSSADRLNNQQRMQQKTGAEKDFALSGKKDEGEGPKKSQKQRYFSAYETLRKGQNARAISEFKSLISEFPRGEYAAKSQYWLGEAHKANKDLRSAKRAFTTVVSEYSNSPKVPDALLKLGYIELQQKNTAKAKEYLSKIRANYQGTTAAHLARKKLMQMGVVRP